MDEDILQKLLDQFAEEAALQADEHFGRLREVVRPQGEQHFKSLARRYYGNLQRRVTDRRERYMEGAE